MYGAVDAGLIMEVARLQGHMWQLNLDLETPPMYTLPMEYFTSFNIGYATVAQNTGSETSFMSNVDHPGFLDFREDLEFGGYIKTASGSNGDVVLKRFSMNNIWLEVNDRFLCAPAWKWSVERANKGEDYGS